MQRVAVGLTVGLLGWLAVGPAEAGRGTFNLFEAGLGTTSAPEGGRDPGWALGVSYGATLKPRWSPVRFYLLANLHGEHLAFDDGYGPWLRRTDLTVSVSQRTLLPVSRLARVYVEAGLGARLGLRDRAAWGVEGAFEPVLLLAVGGQLRWSRDISTGLRVATEPLAPRVLPIDDGVSTRPRVTALVTLGVHF